MDDVSYLEKLGESRTCITMDGTPPKVAMRSRSMSWRARSASKWCIMMILPPAARFVTMTEWHPVAWNSGTERRKAGWFCSSSVVAGCSPGPSASPSAEVP